MTIIITSATPDDLPALAEINRSAYSLELPSRFAYKRWSDEEFMVKFFKGRLAERFRYAGTQVFKALDSESGNIAGFVCWTHETGNGKLVPTPTNTIMEKTPMTFEVDFMTQICSDVEQLREPMKREEHYYLSAFAVDPCQQGKGVGSMLLRHCMQIADDAALPAWLISFPGSHNLYLRFGFCDTDYRDVDLNAWDQNRLRGFGLYRHYAMVRRPA
ncbi:acyl-CoA N-acyltransferase [Astrocystis sublimbata]|nr:acyl-CoA N-acyltransferase [Astrocystis sublimbata]